MDTDWRFLGVNQHDPLRLFFCRRELICDPYVVKEVSAGWIVTTWHMDIIMDYKRSLSMRMTDYVELRAVNISNFIESNHKI